MVQSLLPRRRAQVLHWPSSLVPALQPVMATEPWSAMSKGEAMAFDFPIGDYEKAAAQHAMVILAKVHEAAASLK